MGDFLDTLARDAGQTIAQGYYTSPVEWEHRPISLRKCVLGLNEAPVIAEIKLASPTFGVIRENVDVKYIASRMVEGGAVGISVLTEPQHFMGSLSNFTKVRKEVEVPLLMKDVFLSFIQIDAASAVGADVVLLIKALFDRGYCECGLLDTIRYIHSMRMEVLLETHTVDEFSSALDTEADLIGINNRDLRTLNVDVNVTRNVLRRVNPREKIIVSESGIETPSDLRFLYAAGARVFLIGSTIMKADDVKKKVEEFVLAL